LPKIRAVPALAHAGATKRDFLALNQIPQPAGAETWIDFATLGVDAVILLV